ncbi:uncharacterized protein I303_106893 [Kwoniella dejecticola CBS 10117]|uniref:Efflux protein EncT n=1 Tax=Kwoniella dejecticola CBS 10117 TaxID=1296121 RepID=A0A1A5ZTE0_9TREE|nr:efflux protein EncT [Kwoniella dejecticola CBS 10117]OBR81086.1 efflux protein EncT [Kwoniella dejecticola CBS 10117]
MTSSASLSTMVDIEAKFPRQDSISSDKTLSLNDNGDKTVKTIPQLDSDTAGPLDQIIDEKLTKPEQPGPAVKLSQNRKWMLLLVFSVAQYLDVAAVSGLFIFTDSIAIDLDVLYEASTWIVTSYVVTFSAFLLFFGRVSDLYSAKPVFAWSFFALGVLSLIISFMTNQYAFFVFRALAGIAGAGTIPSAFRLILTIFEPEELHVALTLFGLSGAIANGTGLIIAGLFGFITAGGQLRDWRFFFRMITAICIPFALVALALVPKTKGESSTECTDSKDRLKRLDIVGTLMMLFAIVLLILGLTLGASYGWTTAKFLAPFLLSWPLFVGFFIWEARLPEGYALIPPQFWKILNMPLMIFVALGIYSWWNINQLALVERFLTVFNEEPIIAALRLLPSGIAAVLVALVMPRLLSRVKSYRWIIATGLIICAATYVLMIYSHGEIYNNQYWKFFFPALFIGSGSSMAVFLGVNITVMTSAPASMSGVAGALLQVALQLGGVIGLSVQAGLLTLHEGNIKNFTNVQASFWFEFGWLVFNALIIIFLFRNKKQSKDIEEGPEEKSKVPMVL